VDQLLQFLIAGLKNGSIYALVALGFTIVYAATGAINFAQGEFFMLGGMLCVSFTELGLSLPMAAGGGGAAPPPRHPPHQGQAATDCGEIRSGRRAQHDEV
jgi:branched-subunit amino acid ABC-type transport system permease component